MSQSAVNRLVTNFVVGDMQAFSVVESPDFIKLVTSGFPGKNVMSRKTLVGEIETMAQSLKQDVIGQLSSVAAVCTTADIWTAHNRSYFGCTVHWVDETYLKRKSAALACKRLYGRHTFDLIASTLEEIHAKYRICDKVVCTVTDNGSNFVKAFAQFGEQPHHTGEDSEFTFSNVDEILAANDGADSNSYCLPQHHRCGAHTMNLVAVADTEAANNNPQYKSISRSTMAKCTALWNKSSRSPLAAEAVMTATQKTLIVPNSTRWNSFYMAVAKIHSIIENQTDSVLNLLCEKLDLPVFRSNEVNFISEYVKVMQPVAKSLDTLQAETHCFMGILLPTLASLRTRLEQLTVTLKYAGPLADAVLAGLDRRFHALEQRRDLLQASVAHPQFKLRWMNSDAAKMNGKAALLEAMQSVAASPAVDVAEASNVNSNDADDFFCFYDSNVAFNSVSAELDMYVNDTSRDVASLHRFPLVKKVFIAKNTALPSSAPVERLFSIGGQILTPRRNGLSDEHFEELLMLRANRHLQEN